METSETYNQLIQVRKISQLTNIHDFSSYDDDDILFVIAARDKALGKWANYSVNKGVLIELLNNINLAAIQEEAAALRDWLNTLQGELSRYESLELAIQQLEDMFDNYYSKSYINSLMGNYYTKQESDARFQPKGNYLTSHHNTGSNGTIMRVPNGYCVTGLVFDEYGHVLDMQYSPMTVTPDVTAVSMSVSGAGLSKNAIYLGEARPSWNNGTVVISYSNGTTKTVTDYNLTVNWDNVNISAAGQYTVSGVYSWSEGNSTLTKTITVTLSIGQLNSIAVSGGYGFTQTSFGVNDTLASWRKGAVTANYTNGLANKTVTSAATVIGYTSSNNNVISVNGSVFTIVGPGTTIITATYSYTEAGITKTITVTQTIEIVANNEYYVYVGNEEFTSEWTTNEIPSGGGTTPTTGLKYYVGRQPVEGGIGTTDYMNTNTAAFLSSGRGISANSINDIKAAITGSINIGSIADGDAILILPTDVANSITSIKNTLGYDLIYDKLTAVDGYTCVFIGDYTLSEINISVS